MGSVTIRGHEVKYIDSIHINPNTFTSNPAVAMVAAPGLGAMVGLGAFIGAAVYHCFSFNGPAEQLPKLGFSDLSNLGGKIGALLTTSLMIGDASVEHGALKVASDLYDAAVFSIEAWPQVMFNEACDLMGANNQEL